MSAQLSARKIESLLSQENIPDSVDSARLDELRRIFARLIASGDLVLSASAGGETVDGLVSLSSDVKIKWNNWLKKKHSIYLSQLSNRVTSGRKSALRTFMGVIASSPSTKHCILGTLVSTLLEALIGDSSGEIMPEAILELFDKEFIQPYRDVQYYILMEIHRLAKKIIKQYDEEKNKENEDQENEKETRGIVIENLLRILLKVEISDSQDDLEPLDVQLEKDGLSGTCSNYLFLPISDKVPIDTDNEEDMEGDVDSGESDNSDSDDSSSEDEDKDNEKSSEPVRKKQKLAKKTPQQSFSRHRYYLQESFLTILQYPHIPTRSLKRSLQHLPNQVLPIVANPLRFADFCSRAYSMRGVMGVLSLHSLFLLMTQCGLEYPKFYASLYNLVQTEVFYTKYRSRFFKLLVNCLTKSQMLPAYIVAAFCKRLCRCALGAPPSGALFVLALVSNLLRKHAECACLVHRGNGEPVQDPYDATVEDPSMSRAIDSSLWELNALQRHYHPAVAALARECGKEDDKHMMHDLDKFLLHTYKSLFDQERKREKSKKNKGSVPLTFQEPEGIFVKGDVFDGIFAFS